VGNWPLKKGIASATGPRTIVFAVSGTIQLKRALVVDKSFLTIAGQTVTVGQSGSAGIAAGFQMTDPGLSSNPTTECRITSGIATTCALQTSLP